MDEKCPCLTDTEACCACISMHCDECHKPMQSKFVQGRFCSNCGRPLKAELQSEFEELKKQNEALTINMNAYALGMISLKEQKDNLARAIIADLNNYLTEGNVGHFTYRFYLKVMHELEKKYIGEQNDEQTKE